MSNVYKKLSQARVMLQKKPIKKSGVNKFSNFNYFELSDFLPTVNAIFAEVGLCSRFYIKPETVDENGDLEKEEAKLEIFDVDNPDSRTAFVSPICEAGMKGATPIQQLGAVHTYMRRYLWLEAMEICESDGIDALPEDKKESAELKATTAQCNIIRAHYTGDNLIKLLQKNNVQKVNDLPREYCEQLVEKLKAMDKERYNNAKSV